MTLKFYFDKVTKYVEYNIFISNIRVKYLYKVNCSCLYRLYLNVLNLIKYQNY